MVILSIRPVCSSSAANIVRRLWITMSIVSAAALLLALSAGCAGDGQTAPESIAEHGTVGGLRYEVVQLHVPEDAPMPTVVVNVVVAGRPTPPQLRAIARHIADEATGRGRFRRIWMGFYDCREFALHGGLTLGSARCSIGSSATGSTPEPTAATFDAAFPQIDWRRQPTAFEARVWAAWAQMATSAAKRTANVSRDFGLTTAEVRTIIDRCNAWQVPSGLIEW